MCNSITAVDLLRWDPPERFQSKPPSTNKAVYTWITVYRSAFPSTGTEADTHSIQSVNWSNGNSKVSNPFYVFSPTSHDGPCRIWRTGAYRVTGQLADKPTRRQRTRRQTNSPTNQIAEIDILTFRLWEQGLIFRAVPTGTDVLGDQKSVPENSEMKFLTMFYHCCDNRAS